MQAPVFLLTHDVGGRIAAGITEAFLGMRTGNQHCSGRDTAAELININTAQNFLQAKIVFYL
jgi:hypothetical protein